MTRRGGRGVNGGGGVGIEEEVPCSDGARGGHVCVSVDICVSKSSSAPLLPADQGCAQCEIWTHRPAPRREIAAGLAAFLQQKDFGELPKLLTDAMR